MILRPVACGRVTCALLLLVLGALAIAPLAAQAPPPPPPASPSQRVSPEEQKNRALIEQMQKVFSQQPRPAAPASPTAGSSRPTSPAGRHAAGRFH